MRFTQISLISALVLLSSPMIAQATIMTSASAENMPGLYYSYTFSISQDGIDSSIFHATLTNTSDLGADSGPKIDLLAFNMDAVLGVDFAIENVSPVWSFSGASGPIQFDYVGDATTPFDKLVPGDQLTFDFNFVDGYSNLSYSLWTGTGSSAGIGIGGGTDSGQVAVSFQTLGPNGQGSDLLASNWRPQPVVEPSTLAIMGLGLLGLGAVRRRQR